MRDLLGIREHEVDCIAQSGGREVLDGFLMVASIVVDGDQADQGQGERA